MRATILILTLLVTLSFLYAGCKSGEQKSQDQNETSSLEKIEEPIEAVVDKTEKMHEEMEAEMDRTAPPKIAAELWELIQQENYSEHWKMWPGKETYREGEGGGLVTTYVNDTAYKAIENNEDMPTGSIVVNEDYDMGKTLESIGVKYKLAGYDKDKDDWFGVTYGPGGKPLNYD